MPGRPGLRKPTYNGQDPSADNFSRGVNDSIRYLQKIPFTDGVLLAGQDFSKTPATDGYSYQLKHSLNRLARGLMIIGVHAKGKATEATQYPVHDSTRDTTSIAYIYMTTDMTTNFTWDIWIW